MNTHLFSRTLAALLFSAAIYSAYAQTAQVQVVFSNRLGPLEINKMALGQGGLSDEPMWADRVTEVRALQPRIIRLFIQEYFDLLPEQNRFHFETLDRSVDTILQTGAKPLMCICFKPRTLFPKIDQDIVEPNDYQLWESLIFKMVSHYKDRNGGGWQWEVGNEPDIGESGGCPYRFKPASYVRYYQHTVSAILKADPTAQVGGPALASCRSPLLPALLDYCHTNKAPLHFVSWHIYSSSPRSVRETIDYVQGLLKKYPSLKPETILDEWNMDLMNPPLDPRFQPCYIAETIWQMKEGKLDYSCYYHIRDWYVSMDKFAPFMSPSGNAFMARWWNRMPQFDGLFDYQNTIRPSYFAFKLLSRMQGDRVQLTSNHPSVHGFATRDSLLRMESLLLWNFSDRPVAVELTVDGLPQKRRVRHITLDAGPAQDENQRLKPEPYTDWKASEHKVNLTVEPYGMHYWSME